MGPPKWYDPNCFSKKLFFYSKALPNPEGTQGFILGALLYI